MHGYLGRGREFIFMFAGGMDIFVPGRATCEHRHPLYRGGTPCPAAACPSPADRHKKYPRPYFFICGPSPGSACCRPRPAPHAPHRSAPHRFRSAPFPPAAALLLATISLNTYLANNKFTSYRSFAAASGCSASIFYPHRSRLRLLSPSDQPVYPQQNRAQTPPL